MGPVGAELEVDAPRGRAFALIADLARRPSFTDHFASDYHLTRLDSTGVGAGARFRLRLAPRRWLDTAIAVAEPPHRVVEHGCGGRGNRIPSTTVWEVLEGSGSLTLLRVTHWTEPSNPLDRALDVLTMAATRQERAWRRALQRMRGLLESSEPVPPPLAVAGGNPHATGIP